MNNRKISIIIPAFNEEQHLPACLESILGLDYPRESVEIIVVDNGSTDSSRDIAGSYGVKVLVDESLRVSGLRNLGARESDGEILAFVDADCIVSRNWLKNASRYFDEADVAAWGAPPLLPEESTWVQRSWYLVRQKANVVQEVEWLESMNLFVRKEAFSEVAGFNEELVTCEDVDLCYRLREHGKIISDLNIEVVHLGEAGTVREFVKKEMWRGHGNLRGVLSHGLSLKELPSLFIPIYFGIIIPVLLFMCVVTFNMTIILAAIILYFMPTLAVLMKVRGKQFGVSDFFGLIVLIQVYFLIRTVAVIK